MSWWVPVLLTAILLLFTLGGLSLLLGFFDDAANETHRNLVFYLKVLAATGSLGGLVSGFMRNGRRLVLCTYQQGVNPGSAHFQCGSLADALIGVGGSWAIFFVLGRSMRLDADLSGLLTLVGLGVVAGFSAPALLALLRKRMLGDVQSAARKTAKRAIKNEAVRIEDYSDISDVYTLIEISDSPLPVEVKRDLLEKAKRRIDYVLSQQAAHANAIVALATVKKRQALLSEDAGAKTLLLDEAINLCSRAFEVKPNLDVAYYNRACYRALRNSPIESIVADIERAIELRPDYKALFRDDPDLSTCRDHPEVARRLA